MTSSIPRFSSVLETLEPRQLLSVPGTFGFGYSLGVEKGTNSGNAVAVDQAGNFFVAGTFKKTVDADIRPHSVFNLTSVDESHDVFVAKYNPSGKLIWARRFGDYGEDAAWSIAVGPTGDLFMVGTYTKLGNFSVGKNKLVIPTYGGKDIFIARLNGLSGNPKWVGHIGGAADDFADSVTVGADGSLFVSGTIRFKGNLDPNGRRTITTRGVDDSFILRLDPDNKGKLLWSRVYGENDTFENATSLAADGAGGVYVAGNYYNKVQFDRANPAFTMTPDGRTDVYLGHLDTHGNWTFLKSIGGSDQDHLAALVRGANNALFITGTFKDDIDMSGDGSAVLSPIGDKDAYVARYDGDGNFVWARQFGGDSATVQPRAITVDARNNVYSTGQFIEETDFNPAGGGYILTTDKDSDAMQVKPPAEQPPFTQNFNDRSDTYISKISSSGKFVYARQIGGDEGSIAGRGIGADAAGNVYLTGAFTKTVDLDPSPTHVVNRTTVKDKDNWMFISKILA